MSGDTPHPGKGLRPLHSCLVLVCYDKRSFSGTPRTPAKDCVLCTPVSFCLRWHREFFEGDSEPWQRTASSALPVIYEGGDTARLSMSRRRQVTHGGRP